MGRNGGTEADGAFGAGWEHIREGAGSSEYASDSASCMEPLLPPAAAEKDSPPSPTDAFDKSWPLAFNVCAMGAAFFLARVSWVFMKATDTALLGHSGTIYLNAAALSDLWTSSSGVFIQGGVLSALCSQAYGAGNKNLVGTWLLVSLFVLFLISGPVATLWALATGPVLSLFGVKGQLRHDAWYYASVLAVAIPARILFSQTSQFLTAQGKMRPSSLSAPFAMMMNLILGLLLVLGIPVRGWNGFGFFACPCVTVFSEYAQFLFLFFVFICWQKVHAECWNGFNFQEVTRARIWTYLKLYLPASLSMASDFWRFSIIGALAAHLSPDDLGVFNASYRILWMCLTFTGSLGAATGTILGQALGSSQTKKAKKVVTVGCTMASALLLVLSILVFNFSSALGSIFTTDPVLINLFKDIRAPFALTLFFMNATVVLEMVPIAMGRTKLVLGIGLIGSWLGQVPAVYILMRFWRNDLLAVYAGVAIGYGITSLLYILVVASTNWQEQVDRAIERSEIKKDEDDDEDRLVGA